MSRLTIVHRKKHCKAAWRPRVYHYVTHDNSTFEPIPILTLLQFSENNYRESAPFLKNKNCQINGLHEL